MHKSRITPNNNNLYHKSALKWVRYMFMQSLVRLIAVLKTHQQVKQFIWVTCTFGRWG